MTEANIHPDYFVLKMDVRNKLDYKSRYKLAVFERAELNSSVSPLTVHAISLTESKIPCVFYSDLKQLRGTKTFKG